MDYITYFLNLPENTEKDAIFDISYLCQPVKTPNQEDILSKPITYYVELTEKRNNIEKIGKIDEKVYNNYLIKSHLQNGVTISNVVTYQEIVDDIHISYLAEKGVKMARKLAKEIWKYGNLYFLNGYAIYQ